MSDCPALLFPRRFLLLGFIMSLASSHSASAGGSISHKSWGSTRDGQAVELYTLTNAQGMEARFSTYGGTLTHWFAPDKEGKLGDVVLGFDNHAQYEKESPYFGCIIGRFGNRLAKGRFTLDGQTYSLATNNGVNHLHGGKQGFDRVVWTVLQTRGGDEPSLEMGYLSKEGEEGYPGTLSIKALYTLTKDNAIRLDFTATTDKATIVNLTQHSYFNLACKGDVLGHQVQIQSDHFLPVDPTQIPTGELRAVKGNQLTAIGARVGEADEQLKTAGGYDHTWIVRQSAPGALTLCAKAFEPSSGRLLEVFSTEPGVQFYGGNFLTGTLVGKGGAVYPYRGGLCFEPQHYPDSPNRPEFPSVVLRPGQTYSNTIIYRLSVSRQAGDRRVR